MMAGRKASEEGYVLILTIVVVSLLTVSVAIFANRTVFASVLANRREHKVQAYQLAESAALEGVWRVSQNPGFRQSAAENTIYLDEQTLGRPWYYRFSVVDPTPETVDDLELTIVGEGFVGSYQSKVTIRIQRTTVSADYAIVSWQETND
jgi:hypothetical protein